MTASVVSQSALSLELACWQPLLGSSCVPGDCGSGASKLQCLTEACRGTDPCLPVFCQKQRRCHISISRQTKNMYLLNAGRPPLRISGSPTCGIHGRSLGPRRKFVGDSDSAADQTRCDINRLQSPTNRKNQNGQTPAFLRLSEASPPVWRRKPHFFACQHAETRSQPIAQRYEDVLISSLIGVQSFP